ncbi:uncharacterized protein [Blastocystis hominis]|uniref:P-type ATPase C-terminal domain-containing protein n=1 Tax=Blastocystis hominis TaxID=12968 RepID=D8M7R8_BLAHO|nr:uncharacterized protein [Blastocystis hominis]CBK24107.2 unnamed protein product [Blastocystis hominis]|eukprot:XP_012898155.1 uncharacterized protein [Blastocystis hominis]
MSHSSANSSSPPIEIQEALEKPLQIQGALAIRDNLVPNVYLSIRRLQAAGIRFWILTGDKASTAESIAVSAGVIDINKELVHLSIDTRNELPFQERIVPKLEELQSRSESPSLLIDGNLIDEVFQQDNESITSLFLKCLCDAPSVIIARMRKDQKQLISQSLKEYGRKKGKQIVHVLCVGDGANDMGMIRESDGKEGLQAFNNADVSIPSFQAMTKLLFVHGKSNENRLQVLVLYFLYKNTLLSILTLILSYLSMFSGIKLMPSWGVDFFNTYFTSVPILTIAAIDFFSDKELLARIPQLYQPSWFEPPLNTKNFIINIIVSIGEGFVIIGFLLLFSGLNGMGDVSKNMSISSSYLGVLAFTILVLVTNIEIFFISSAYSILLIIFDVVSVLLWFLTLAVTSGIAFFPAESEDLYGSFLVIVVDHSVYHITLFDRPLHEDRASESVVSIT